MVINETIECHSEKDIPTIEELHKLPRNKTLTVVFGKDILDKKTATVKHWNLELKDFNIGIDINQPSIHLTRLISDDEIIEHQDFFEQCAKDYRDLSKQLIYKLANHLNIEISPEAPLNGFLSIKGENQKRTFDNWEYHVHGHHCCFENLSSKQIIEVSLIHGLEFGALDPYFFIRFINTTPDYKPLPLEIYHDEAVGRKILKKMEEIGKFEKINAIYKNRYSTVVTDREKIPVQTYYKNTKIHF